MGEEETPSQGSRPVRSSGERLPVIEVLDGPWSDYNWRPIRQGERLSQFQHKRCRYPDGSHLPDDPSNIRTHESTSSASALSPAPPSNAPNPGVGGTYEGATKVKCARCDRDLGLTWAALTTPDREDPRFYCSYACALEAAQP